MKATIFRILLAVALIDFMALEINYFFTTETGMNVMDSAPFDQSGRLGFISVIIASLLIGFHVALYSYIDRAVTVKVFKRNYNSRYKLGFYEVFLSSILLAILYSV
ncbi:hypothetical protein [Pseudomonas aeruginosa]|uniref:hypothetical protein n=1 Tax=Pseudomonas aeruginosa TaxID=287 RepID=UPI002342396A|nr:hypothetical protein [Pseudomonas aeruginosa]MDC3841915.1 hypothetical protein [Pseudomonas aeruginosa]